MVRPSEDDRADIDRAFAELVAGYHLTADRPDPLIDETPAAETPAPPEAPATRWIESPRALRFEPPVPEPVVEAEPEDLTYEPDPLPPMRAPGVPALVGWIGIAYAVVVALAGTFGITFPTWAGWLAVAGFIGGFGLLLTRLPRYRPPGSGNGAVV